MSLSRRKRNIKKQIQLADGIIKEDLYTAYYVVSENEEIVADREIEIPGMEEKTAVEEVVAVVVEPDANVEVMNPNNNQNEIGRQKEQTDSAREQQIDLHGKEAKYQWELSEYLNRDICQPEGFDAYGYPSELFKLDMERLGIAAKRKPAKVIDFAQYIKNNRGTND